MFWFQSMEAASGLSSNKILFSVRDLIHINYME